MISNRAGVNSLQTDIRQSKSMSLVFPTTNGLEWQKRTCVLVFSTSIPEMSTSVKAVTNWYIAIERR